MRTWSAVLFVTLGSIGLRPSSAGADGSGDAGAAQGPVTVATEWVPLDVPREKGEPFRADLGPATIEISERLPSSLKAALPSDGRVLYGEVAHGSKKAPLALVLGADDALTVFVDANGDAALGPDEGTRAALLPRAAGGATAWKVADLKVGGGRAAISVQRPPYAFAGWIKVESKPDEMPIPDARLVFSAEKPAGLAKAPDLAGRILYASGDVGGTTVVVAAVRGAGDGLTVVVDANGDGVLAGAGERRDLPGSPVEAQGPLGPRRIGTAWATPDGFSIGGRHAAVQLSEIPGEVAATAAPVGSRRGKVEVGGKPYELYLLDGDFDGRVDSAADLWWFGPAGLFSEDRQPMYATLFEGNEPVFPSAARAGVGAWRLASLAPDGTAVVRPAADAGSVEDYLRRRTERVNKTRWFPRFDEEARDFSAKHRLDAKRPKAGAPPAWRFLIDMNEACALAAKEGKPLLVDFEADWCAYCKRLDYYTYPDRQVAEWVAKFTAVKMNRELDEKRTFYGFKDPDGKPWSFIPAVAVFGADGKPVSFPFEADEKGEAPPVVVNHVPWASPASLVKALEAAYAAWEASAVKPPGQPGGLAPR